MAQALQGCNGYIVSLGTLEPRKNILRLLDAWQAIDRSERANIKLVIVGMRGWLQDKVTAERHEIDDSVVFAGFIEDSELNFLLKGALALVYPSLYEGFGLPVLEAMSLGVPVLTNSAGATGEISGNAALLVDATRLECIRDGLLQLLQDPQLRERLSQLGRVQAAHFSWKATAEQTLQVLECATLT